MKKEVLKWLFQSIWLYLIKHYEFRDRVFVKKCPKWKPRNVTIFALCFTAKTGKKQKNRLFRAIFLFTIGCPDGERIGEV
jgi:hypothetical protein